MSRSAPDRRCYSTVKIHISHLLTKLDARDRAQLVMIAFRSGLVRP